MKKCEVQWNVIHLKKKVVLQQKTTRMNPQDVMLREVKT